MSLRAIQIVDDGFVVKMLANPNWAAAFPFLRRYASILASDSSCGSCHKRTTPQRTSLMEIKMAVANLPVVQQLRFKEMARAKMVCVIYRDAQNNTRTITF